MASSCILYQIAPVLLVALAIRTFISAGASRSMTTGVHRNECPLRSPARSLILLRRYREMDLHSTLARAGRVLSARHGRICGFLIALQWTNPGGSLRI